MSAGAEAIPLNMQAACVFGGGNGWGKRIAGVLAESGSIVHIVEKQDGADAAAAAIAASDAVFIAIPDEAIDALLQAHRTALQGKLILDCATNKSGFGESLQQLAAAGNSVCSTHPMAASTGVLLGQNALIMPIGANASGAECLAQAVYGALGMHCRRIDFRHHAELMAVLQMLPHVVQRLFIDALGRGLAELDIGVGELGGLASANYLLAELGLGRVAAQRPEISAGIIATALREPFGQTLLDDLRQNLTHIRQAGQSRAALEQLFSEGTQRLDPDGAWRKAMAESSEAALIRLGNLRSRALTIQAPNRIGRLRDILIVLADHDIDMTALDSQLMQASDGSERVNFDIAISNETVPHEKLAVELSRIGAQLLD